MRRSSRLTRSEDIRHVRQAGRTFAHRTIVLGVLPNQLAINRTAVIAGRSVGGAVQRNLAKRRMRSAFRPLEADLDQGYDLILIARKSILDLPYPALSEAMRTLFLQAELMKDDVN